MVGITKIKKITNAGIYSSYEWPASEAGKQDLSFKKINLVYGCNGSGKTTLTNILGLFSESHHERDEIDRKRIVQGISADPSKSLEIEIEWDGITAKYPNDKKKIYVFNSAFVSDHVYNGTQAKVKKFKQVTTNEQLSNPALKKIEEEITAEITKKGTAESYITKLKTLFEDLKTSTSKNWRENLQGKKTPDLMFDQCPQQVPQESEDDLENALIEEFAKFKAESNRAALDKAISDLAQIIANSVDLPEGISDTIVQSIAKTAREKVQAKIDVLKAHTLRHGSIQNWFEDGANLLKQTKDNQKCPLCDSALPNIEDLIASYDAYFNDELVALMQEIGIIIAALEGLSTESDNKKYQSQRVQTLIAEYGYQDTVTDDEKSALSSLEAQEIRDLIQSVKAFFDSKKESIDFTPTKEQLEKIKSLLTATTEFLEDVALLVSVKDKMLTRLQAVQFDDGNAREICRKLFWKRFEDQGKAIADEARKVQEEEDAKLEILDGIGGIGLLHFAQKTLELIQDMLTKKEGEKAAELSKLKKESEYVNGFLSRLCINNFTINTQDDGEITVHYSGAPPKKGIHYSLSEGEKTALAFAYFLSKYRHEVFDNPQEKQEEYTIVIDDPVSSLDENRLFSTALVIQDVLIPKAKKETDKGGQKTVIWEGCNQIIILSHNIVFLKFMSNIIDPNQSDVRADLYIEKSAISLLPESLRNYQTSYFQKLEKIQSYVIGDISYDRAKDYIPNYIRVTLEAFIAFKFARLRGDNKNLPAMLDSLINNITSDATAFDKFEAVAGIINTQTLKTVLSEIKQKTNPESHGTVQDITHIEYLPETELKKLAEQTLNVIKFLDQIHFKKAQKLQQAAA